jgi:hypothetical protein
MNEFLYKVNLPPLTDFLLDSAAEKLFVGQDKSFHKTYKPIELLKPEYLLWKSYSWDFVNFFYKTNGYKGHIHIDGGYGNWGLNWIYGGTGIMEYWLPENVTILPIQPDDIGGKIIKCVTDNPPDKVYNTTPGAYLIKTSTPHRATGFNGRHAFSLRATKQNTSWEKAVSSFSDLFI